MAASAKYPQVRDATVEDAAAIAAILSAAFEEFEPLYTARAYQATTPGPNEVRIRMREGPIWIALNRSHIIGTVSVVLKESGLYVRGMAVVPTARGLGVGAKLLDKVETYASALSCRRLFLSTTPFLKRAIRLYESFGFRTIPDGPRDLFGTPLFTMEKILQPRQRLELQAAETIVKQPGSR